MGVANSGSVGRGKPFGLGNRAVREGASRLTATKSSYNNPRSARDTERPSRGC